MALPSQPAGEGASACPTCGAAVVADQRYCLACGQPCSPTRLDFLDVLQADRDERAQMTVLPPAAYLPALEPDGAIGWLRRYSGLLALLGVLLVTGLIGLLIGHWTKSPAAAGPQVVKIEGLSSASTVASTPAVSTTPTTSAAKQVPQSKAQEEEEVKETEASTVKAPPPAKVNSSSLKKLSKTTGKTHQKEIESLTAGGKPIETGG
ncbi:MAG TPA: zinc ribbon domain-containing protein [Solirubrobacteraceae bacterium]|nr:zinc ribbon domain-containing protein [Solirubrobacteraceae bacterium]